MCKDKRFNSIERKLLSGLLVKLLTVCALLMTSLGASAYCGFYFIVSGTDGPAGSPGAACSIEFFPGNPVEAEITSPGRCTIRFDSNSDGIIDGTPTRDIDRRQCPSEGSIGGSQAVRDFCGKPCKKKCPETSDSNPIDVLTGYKYQSASDHLAVFGSPALTLDYFWDGDAGRWTFGVLENQMYITSNNPRTVIRGDGTVFQLTRIDGANGSLYWEDDRGYLRVYPEVGGGYSLEYAGNVETYDNQGRLIKVDDRQENVTSIDWSNVIASDTLQDFILIDVSNLNTDVTVYLDDVGRPARIIGPDGQESRYEYVSAALNILRYISFSDDTTGQAGTNPFGEDNPFREYRYDDTRFPTALTSMIDELGNPYSGWEYDAEGRAIASFNLTDAGQTEVARFALDFTNVDHETDPRVTETNSLGISTTYHFERKLNQRLETWVERDAHDDVPNSPTRCEAADNYVSYDALGKKDLVTDWEGNVTDYNFDPVRGLELSRTEGLRWLNDEVDSSTVSTPETRTITTTWHPEFRLKTRIEYPDKVVDMTYDCDNGRMLSRKEWELAQAPVYTAPVCP